MLQGLRALGWSGPAVLITAFASPDLAARASAAGFARVLDKPLVEQALGETVERLVGLERSAPTTY